MSVRPSARLSLLSIVLYIYCIYIYIIRSPESGSKFRVNGSCIPRVTPLGPQSRSHGAAVLEIFQ